MWNFVFDHVATCTVYRLDSATQYADYGRLKRQRKVVRPMTLTEWDYTLIIAPGWLTFFTEDDRPTTLVAPSTKGRQRLVAGFDPNKIAELLTVKG